jgi:hypothetical protein
MGIIHEPEKKNGECAAYLKYSVLMVVVKVYKIQLPSYIYDALF